MEEKEDSQITLNLDNIEDSEIIFQLDHTWVLKLTGKGIEFNREAFPEWEPDDFAEKFIEIIDKCLMTETGYKIPTTK